MGGSSRMTKQEKKTRESTKSDWIVNDNIVKSVRLIQPYDWYLRYDTLPFMIAYSLCIPLSLWEGVQVSFSALFSMAWSENDIFSLLYYIFQCSMWG